MDQERTGKEGWKGAYASDIGPRRINLIIKSVCSSCLDGLCPRIRVATIFLMVCPSSLSILSPRDGVKERITFASIISCNVVSIFREQKEGTHIRWEMLVRLCLKQEWERKEWDEGIKSRTKCTSTEDFSIIRA